MNHAVDAGGVERQSTPSRGLYRPEEFRDNCGFGLIAHIKGEASHRLLQTAIESLTCMTHRGGIAADGRTGDGCGLLLQMPDAFMRAEAKAIWDVDLGQHYAVGMMFLSRDQALQAQARESMTQALSEEGLSVWGWREVPIDESVCGEIALDQLPRIEQVFVDANGIDHEHCVGKLYTARRKAEMALANDPDFYICSLSDRVVSYKGLVMPADLERFYPDLNDPALETAICVFHQRFSTNTLPRWPLAQPFRMLAHNGEINTLKGNVNWMKSHEIRMASATFGDMAEDIKPIVQSGSSDSAALDAVFEALVRAGRNAPMAKTMLVPESWSKQAVELPQAWRDMYSYCNSVMEPWDGPAALAMTDGRWVCAGLDRNGLRPMRYVITGDGLLIAGSEAGMVPVDESTVKEKGALGPGQLLAVDMAEGALYHDTEIKDKLAASQPFGEWVGKITELDEELAKVTEKAIYSGDELRRRQIAAGYTIEELEQILSPMVEDAKEALASMGDDTPSAVLSKQYRPLSHFFRQNFSQVTNPPIDSLREYRVMSLKTRFGNLKNVLDESSSQTEIIVLDSPFLGNAQWARVQDAFNADMVEIDCTFASGPGALQKGLERIRAEAEDAVRSGAGHLVLTDQHQGADRVAMPMILATSAVHSHLTRKGLRTFCSLNVRSAECIDPHYFAVLIGCGATTVNAYLAEDSIADRIERGLLDGPLTEAVARYREAIDQGLLKIMAKMGISVISSYRGGLNFEAVGLSRAMCAEYFPGMTSRISGIGAISS